MGHVRDRLSSRSTEGTVTEKRSSNILEMKFTTIQHVEINNLSNTHNSKSKTTEQALEVINSLEFNHLDLNIGCPSRRVNAH